MKKKTRQTGLLLSVLMLATTSLYPVSAFAEETTEAPAEAITEAAEKSDAKTMMTGNWAPATRERIQSVIDANADSGRYVVFDFDNTSAIVDGRKRCSLIRSKICSSRSTRQSLAISLRHRFRP